ncbi:MAG: hypothetical protein ACYC26_04595 [Phycisphaerales bacterium]
MMEAKALKQAGAGGAGTSTIGPMVLLDGCVRWDVWVKRVMMRGVLDEREVELAVKPIDAGYTRDQRLLMERLRGARVTILAAVGLEGGEARLWPMMTGRVTRIGQTLDGNRDEWTVTGRCDWSLMLDQRLEDVADAAALAARLGVSDAASWAGEGISGSTMRAAMEDLCERLGWSIQRHLSWIGQSVHETRRPRPRKLGAGRRVVIGGGRLSDAAGVVRAMRGAIDERGPVKMTAEMGAQEVESTFTLTAGWPAWDEGKADAEYVKSTSGDFDAVANVYRAWVLNEDGTYDGAAFDLTSLFGDGLSMAGRTVRFRGCLTRDEAGRSLGVVVEMSVDGGENWVRYPGRLSVMTDRAGVYLEDDALPPAFFAAAKTGQARVRVTATVASAWPTRRVRWMGNPFAGRFEETRFDVRDRFAWRRVDATSRYANAVARGQRAADVADERMKMEQWLATQAANAKASPVKMRMTGPMLGLRVGDRLGMIDGWEIGVTTDEPGIARRDVTLTRIEHRWDSPVGSELMWEVR